MRPVQDKMFVTHCDEAFLVYAERLFDSMAKKSQKTPILFFTVNFDYAPKHNFVKSARLNTEKYNEGEETKVNLVFLKPVILELCLKEFDANTFF